jgi:hypothetical protein
MNDRSGDSTTARANDIRDRAEAWDALQPRLRDTAAWAALSDQQRQDALEQIATNSPKDKRIDLHPLYPAGSSTASGTGTPGAQPFIPYPVERPPQHR